mmetsp:Transcript_47118/g.86438  ORF Transcript_47118/g.86438 Transcript_47118/m.86438 type:complete len:788 (+) Transcript_47118:67-2430(+)
MAPVAPESDGAGQGRALLTVAVTAITEGRWDDLSDLMQSHSQELHAARDRINAKFERLHGTAAVENGASKAPTASKRSQAVKTSRRDPYEQHRLQAQVQVSRGFKGWADRHPCLAICLTQALVLVAYMPGLFYSEFMMDDTVGIVRNPNVVSEEVDLQGYLQRDFWGLPMHGSGWTNKSFRPLTTLTFRWNYLLHGLESSGFHIANVLLHCIASVVVGLAAWMVCGFKGMWAAAAALFFGLHPVHTENVLYLVGRADILAAILGLLALGAYAWCFCPPRPPSHHRTGRGLASRLGSEDFRWLPFMLIPVVLIIASGLCKETGFMFFSIVVGLEMLNYFATTARAKVLGLKIHAQRWLRMKVRWVVLVVLTVFVFLCRYRYTGGTKLNMSPQDNPISFESSSLVRVLSYSYLHGVYVRLLCWPQFLCYDYSMDAIPVLREWVDCRLLLPLAAYTGLCGTASAVLSMEPQHRRAGLVALALMVVPFLPASNIFFPVGTVIGERLLYMPSVGFSLLVILWLRRIVEGPPVRVRRVQKANNKAEQIAKGHRASASGSSSGGSLLCKIACGATLITLGVRTHLRVRTWESSETLFITDGHRQPRSSKVQFNLGITYMHTQEWDSAVEALIRCAWADPLSALPFFRIGQIEILRGRFETAETYLSAAIDKFGASLMVRDEEVFHDLAVAMFQNGKVEAAERRLRIALRLNEDFAKGWNNLGCCIAERDIQQAVRAVRRAATIEPGNPQYWANLALLAQHSGDWNTASSAWRQASSIYPQMPEPRDCTWEFAPA